MREEKDLKAIIEEMVSVYDRVLEGRQPKILAEEVGITRFLGSGVARVEGLPNVRFEEVVVFSDGVEGMTFNLDQDEVGVILLGDSSGLKAGSEVQRTGRIVDVPVGESLLGRVVDALGRPLDRKGPLRQVSRWPIERDAPAIMDRDPVTVPLQTGLKVIDALIPVGRGQRELILGDRQTGKTAVAIDTIINQKDKDVICVYCAVGQRDSAVASVIADLQEHDAMSYSVVVVAAGADPPGLRFIAPYAATTMAEYFTEKGKHVLIVYDDLTRHALAYRELSLLLRRPPGREAFPGDVFYIHSRLLERSTCLRKELGSGTLTALPIAETEAQNISAYIPTNLISITDGQIYLSPDMFQKGMLPAVDVGESVSRVGGNAQLAAYRAVAGDLRLSYSQFVELEAFARFGTRLDKSTLQTLEQGRRVREVLKQTQYAPLSVGEQIVVLLAVTYGAFDDLDPEDIEEAQRLVRDATVQDLPEVLRRIESGEALSDEGRQEILETARNALAAMSWD